MDFLESPDSIFLADGGLSSLLQDCGDFDMTFPKSDATDILSTLNSIPDLVIDKPVERSDHDYASTQINIMSLADSNENISDSGAGSSPTSSRSPGSAFTGGSPSNEYQGSTGSSPSDVPNEFSTFLEGFDFGDTDLENLANTFPVDSDDLLSSCLSESPRSNNEATCIDLNDALETCESLNTDSMVKSQIRINIPGVTIGGVDCDIISAPGPKAKNGVRCTLPNFRPLVLTEEEKKLLALENVSLPTDLPLTKSEERILKKVRRKIRNKKSAMESRKRRKDYLGGLETRVAQCTKQNNDLIKKVKDLENQNQTLMNQLKRLQEIVRLSPGITNKTTQATTCVMILLLSFGLFLAPNYGPLSITSEELPNEPEAQVPSALANSHKSRRMLSDDDITDQPLVKMPRMESFVGVKEENEEAMDVYDTFVKQPHGNVPHMGLVKNEADFKGFPMPEIPENEHSNAPGKQPIPTTIKGQNISVVNSSTAGDRGKTMQPYDFHENESPSKIAYVHEYEQGQMAVIEKESGFSPGIADGMQGNQQRKVVHTSRIDEI